MSIKSNIIHSTFLSTQCTLHITQYHNIQLISQSIVNRTAHSTNKIAEKIAYNTTHYKPKNTTHSTSQSTQYNRQYSSIYSIEQNCTQHSNDHTDIIYLKEHSTIYNRSHYRHRTAEHTVNIHKTANNRTKKTTQRKNIKMHITHQSIQHGRQKIIKHTTQHKKIENHVSYSIYNIN